MTVTKNTSVLQIPVLYEEYQIDFSLTVSSRGSENAFHGLIRLTNTNTNSDLLGDTIPRLQIRHHLKQFQLSTTFNKDFKLSKKATLTQAIPTGTKKSMQIKQEVASSGFKLTLTYDGTDLITKVFHLIPPEFEDVNVFVSDSFDPAIPATVEDLVIKTCKLYPISRIYVNVLIYETAYF